MKIRLIILFIGLLSLCFADNTELNLYDVTIIQDSTGLTRILFKFDVPQSIDTAMIDYAVLFIPRFLLLEPEYALTLEARLLLKPWESSTVSWCYPWETPGG
jgi:hypothetical protein